jgi:hypothetical protein
MLFLLIMEVLSALICIADDWSLLQDLGVCSIPHRTTFYTDDLILVIRSAARDMHALCNIFTMFEGVFGL